MRQKQTVNVTRVIDGDTVEVQTKPGLFRNGRKERVRLYGIDAPESSQTGGPESTKHLKRIIGSGKNVRLEQSGKDRYGRTVGLIYHRKSGREKSYNHQMVSLDTPSATCCQPATGTNTRGRNPTPGPSGEGCGSGNRLSHPGNTGRSRDRGEKGRAACGST